jgi:hypothetical protein
MPADALQDQLIRADFAALLQQVLNTLAEAGKRLLAANETPPEFGAHCQGACRSHPSLAFDDLLDKN